MKTTIMFLHTYFFYLLMLMFILISPASATISVSTQTGIETEGWDGPGLGSATIQWYLGRTNFCNTNAGGGGDRGLTADGGLTRAQVEAAVTAAMDTWSNVADITFLKVGDSSVAGDGCFGAHAGDMWDCDGDPTTYQINLYWARDDHCDGAANSFDGAWNPTTNAGSQFGHSWGPPDIWSWAVVGNVHLDEDENWVTSGATDVGGPNSGLTSVSIDIQSEVLHELGHSIGLAHSPSGTDSIMEALSWNLQDRILTPYDVSEIEKLYATPSNKPGVVLLFDLSGSMEWDADGNTGVPVDIQRLSFAKRAAKPFMVLLNTYGVNVAEFAIANFTSANGGCNGGITSPMMVINAASLQAAISDTPPGTIDSMNAGGSTPLLAGVTNAMSLFTDHDNKAIILLSDGYHNCPSSVSVGEPAVNNLIAQLNNANITVNTIGFGRPSDIDHPLLETLASNTNSGGVPGYFYDVTVPGFDVNTFDQATALQSTYKDILVNHLGLETAVDPLGIATVGSAFTREVKISPYDRKISFFVSWKTQTTDRLIFDVRSSDGQPVLATAAGVDLHSGHSYSILTVDEPFLTQAGKVSASPWTIKIIANNFKKGDQEHYQYSVVMDSRLKLKPIMEAETQGTGSKIKVRASIRAGNTPVTGLNNVQLDVLRPNQSIGTWFANNIVSKDVLKKFSITTVKDTLSPLARKALYLVEKKGVKFPALTTTPVMRLFDDGSHGDQTANDGVYTNLFDDTKINGTYTLRVRASGSLSGDGIFEREATVKRQIPAIFNPDNSDVSVARLADKRITVTFTPRDTMNNYIGPGYSGMVGFSAEKTEPVGKIQDNLDGTYTQTFKIIDDVKDGLGIKVSIGDKTKSLTWVSEVKSGLPGYIFWMLIIFILILLVTIIKLLNK